MHSKINDFTKIINDNLYNFFDVEHCEECKVVFESMRYSVENGGKRVRPLLALLFCDACGAEVKKAIPVAQAIEFVHTYSLIHDDLPCMDNDDFRRGKPSNHKVYGETMALLAGDALLTAAFEIISHPQNAELYSAETAMTTVYYLSHLAGTSGMIGGQVIDILNENCPDVNLETLMLMDKMKTAALIEAACVLGCAVADADMNKINAARKFALDIGLAFQIKDDILDVTSSLEKLGKMTGSDEQNGKSTYVTILGVDTCQKIVRDLTQGALSALDAFENNEALKEYAEYLSKRDY